MGEDTADTEQTAGGRSVRRARTGTEQGYSVRTKAGNPGSGQVRPGQQLLSSWVPIPFLQSLCKWTLNVCPDKSPTHLIMDQVESLGQFYGCGNDNGQLPEATGLAGPTCQLLLL